MGHRVAELEVVVNANTGQAQRELNNLNRTFHNIIAGGALLGAGGGLLGWFKDAVTSGAQFEQTMIRVQQLATGAEVSVDALTKKAFAVDQTTIYSAQEIAQAMEQLGREGFTGEQILGGWTDAAVNFAAVIDEDLTLATNIFGQVARVFKDEGLSAARTADILSQAILRSGRPAAEFATGMQYIGSIASQLGVPLEETAVSLSYLQSLGIKGRSAGTGLRSMFTELAAGADEFGMSHGVQAFDPVTGDFVGMPKIIDQFNDLLSTMSKAEGLSFLTDIFGKPAASPLYALFTGGTEAYEEHLAKMEDLGTAATFMRTLMDTIGGSLDRFEAAASNAMRQIGVIGGNMIRPFIDLLTELLSAFSNAPRIVHIAAAAFVVLTGALMGLAGAIMVFRGLGGFGLLFSGLGIMGATFLGLVAIVGAVVAAFIFFRDEIGAAKDAVADFFDPISELFDYLSRINQADNPLDFLLAQGWDGPLVEFARGLGKVVEGLADLWYFISRGDWERFMRRLPGELEQMWEGVQMAFNVVPEVFGFENWRDMVLNALAWTGENLIFDPIVAVISGTIQLLGDLADAAGDLWGWVKRKIGGGEIVGGVNPDGSKYVSSFGGNELSVGTVLVNGTVMLGEGLANIAGRLWEWIEGKLGGHNMGNTGLFDPVSGDAIYANESHKIDMGKIVIDAAAELADDIWGAGKDFAGWVKGKIEEVGDIFVDVDGIKIRPVNAAIADLTGNEGGGGGNWLSGLGESLSTLLENSEELIASAGTGFGKMLGKAISALAPDDLDTSLIDSANFGQNIGAWLHDALALAVKAPALLVSGIATFIGNAISAMTLDDLKAIPNIGASIITAIQGFLVGLLTGKDSSEWSFGEFSQGLGNKIGDAIKGAFEWATGKGGENASTGLFDEMGNPILSDSNTAFGGILTSIEEGIRTFIGELATSAGAFKNDIIDAIKKIIPDDFGFITEGFNGLITALEGVWTRVDEWVRKILGRGNEGKEAQNEFATIPIQFPSQDPSQPGMGANIPANATQPTYPIGTGVPFPVAGAGGQSWMGENGEPVVEPIVTFKPNTEAVDSEVLRLREIEIEPEVKMRGIDAVMTDFAAAFDMGRAWASQTYEAKADLNVNAVMISAAAAFDMGRAWDAQNFIGDFSLNVDAVMIAAGAAFDMGRAWDGQVFTASFSVDTSGITNAVEIARQAAADIAAVMPHSPAKEGPLKEPITFDYIGENFSSVADDIRYSANRLTTDVAGLRNRNMAPVDVSPSRNNGGITKNYYFAVTGDDLARLERQSREGSLDVETTARELEMALGMN